MNFSLKAKFLPLPLATVATRFSLLFLLLPGLNFAQTQPRTIPGTLQKSDTIRADSVAPVRKSDIETTIVYSARDSINMRADRKIVYLYGDAKIRYGSIELMAEEIVIDYDKSTISANGKLDSAGRRVGYPIFINGQEKYETKNIVYNFSTRRARISEVVTQQGESYLHGKEVMKTNKDELLSVRNAYTTCNLADPHYEIIATRAKAIPGDKMVVGPFYMTMNHVHPNLLSDNLNDYPNIGKYYNGFARRIW